MDVEGPWYLIVWWRNPLLMILINFWDKKNDWQNAKMMINIQLTLTHENMQNLMFFIILPKNHYYYLCHYLHIHMGFFKFTARVLIVTALISSAYHHLNDPSSAVKEFTSNYKVIDHYSNQYLSYDIPFDNVTLPWPRLTGLPLSECLDFSRLWWAVW